MEHKTEITTIILDIGNVLAEFRWEAYLKDCGYSQETIWRVASATVSNSLWKQWDRGDIEEDELLEQCCLKEPEVEQIIRRFFADLQLLVREYNYSTAFVKNLKGNGYKVYLLSNFAKSHYLLDQDTFQFLSFVDGGVISYEVNRIKPEPEIYEALIKKYGINPKEAVFLDDLEENLAAARPFGFRTIKVESYEQMLGDLKKLGVRTE